MEKAFKIPTIGEVIKHYQNALKVCNKKIEELTHPEIYGCCISNCNSIVINKERTMCVKVDETRHTTYEFSPLYPTYFSPKAAKKIVENDVYTDINGNRLKLEIVGELEYYKLLKELSEKRINVLEKYNQGGC